MDKRQRKKSVASSDEWYTPKWIIDELGPFDLDPCAPMQPPFEIAPLSYNKEQNGLAHDWPRDSVVWMNPPYSSKPLRAFCEKLADHGNGIALLVNRQDNLLWQEVIFPSATSMIFMRHRIKFTRPDGTTGHSFFGSCLVAFGNECDKRLKRSKIEGKYVLLNSKS